MKNHLLKVFPSKLTPPKEQQLAWQFAKIAKNTNELSPEVVDMIINRIIDNASVALASINRHPIVSARGMALAHPGKSLLFGCPQNIQVSPEWASWANGTAVRELDYHDTFLAAEYSHPGDNIPPILAVAQHTQKADGKRLIQAIATAYEIHVALVKSICLHEHKIDHIAHIGPASAAGIGTLLDLDIETIFQAIQQGLHVTCTTRQSRKGEISSWKAYAPAHATKLAVEAVDRAMRGETSPTPIYEGEDSVVAWMLNGPEAEYQVPILEDHESKAAILETYTKAHSAEYQSQALIDLAFKMRKQVEDTSKIQSILIKTSHHTHFVIGTGSNDPQKFDPNASRETLDHSIMYIFTVAFQDGSWHHLDSYAPERAKRPDTVALWKKVVTQEEAIWTQRYHDVENKAFGGEVEITLEDGSKIVDSLAIADANPLGADPWKRPHYLHKLRSLTEGIVSEKELNRFIQAVENLPVLKAEDLHQLNLVADLVDLQQAKPGIF